MTDKITEAVARAICKALGGDDEYWIDFVDLSTAAIAAYRKEVASEAVARRWRWKDEDHWEDADLYQAHQNQSDLIICEPLFAAPPAPQIPAGWKLVPVEPTQEILDVFQSYCFPHDDAKTAYAELLEAAPTPEASHD